MVAPGSIPGEAENSDTSRFIPPVPIKTVLVTLLLTLVTVGFAASLVLAADVYLLMFLSILAAVLFSNLATHLGNWSPFPYGVNLAFVVVSLLVLAVSTSFYFGWRIECQIRDSSEQVDRSYAKVEQWLEDHRTVRAALRRVPLIGDFAPVERDGRDAAKNGEANPNTGSQRNGTSSTANSGFGADEAMLNTVAPVSERIFGVFGKLFTTTFGFAMNVAFILFVSVFLAIKPHFYRDGLARLFAPSNRRRATEILNSVGDTLFRWVIGRAATMAITGVGTGITLWLIGVPLALTLGIVTGLLTFIPNIGSILALLLAMLVAASQGTATVMWVVIAYTSLQFIESNLVTPLIQQKQTSVPPPILLSAQLMMGALLGFLGVLVATPLAAVVILLVNEVYVADFLGEDHA